jgi:hypothetical protein
MHLSFPDTVHNRTPSESELAALYRRPAAGDDRGPVRLSWGLRCQPKRHNVPGDRLLTNDSQNLGLQRHEGSHLLFPVPGDAVGSEQPAEGHAKAVERPTVAQR